MSAAYGVRVTRTVMTMMVITTAVVTQAIGWKEAIPAKTTAVSSKSRHLLCLRLGKEKKMK